MLNYPLENNISFLITPVERAEKQWTFNRGGRGAKYLLQKHLFCENLEQYRLQKNVKNVLFNKKKITLFLNMFV